MHASAYGDRRHVTHDAVEPEMLLSLEITE